MCHDYLVKTEGKKGEQGVVLLIVLILMVSVAALATEIIKSARYDYSGAAFLKNSYVSSALLSSACETTQGLYIKNSVDKNGTAFQRFASGFNSTLVHLSSYLTVGDLSGKVEDENSRFPLSMQGKNATIMENILTNMLVNLCVEHGYSSDSLNTYARTYVGSIRCWQGAGTDCAADEFYDSAGTEYARPKQAILIPDELLLIKRPANWLTDEEFRSLYYGTENIAGLKDLVTSFSNGPMNINTLKKEIIMAFVPLGMSAAERLNFYDAVMDRKRKSHAQGEWFNSIKNAYSRYEENIPELRYNTDVARVRINYCNGIYRSSIIEVFEVKNKKARIKYKKFGF